METINGKTILDALQGKLTELAAGLQPYMGNGGVQAFGHFAAHPLARELGFTNIDAASMGLYPEEWINPHGENKAETFACLKVHPAHYQTVQAQLGAHADSERSLNPDEKANEYEFKLANSNGLLTIRIMQNDLDGNPPADDNSLALYNARGHFDCWAEHGLMPSYQELVESAREPSWPAELKDSPLPAMFPETGGRLLWVEQWVQAMSHVSGISLGEMDALYMQLGKRKLTKDDFLARIAANGAVLSPALALWLDAPETLIRKSHFAYWPAGGRSVLRCVS
jgi:hypothetical protein